MRQAIYSGLLARERRALHARVALAIENGLAGDAEGSLETLAYHAFEAGHWERARQLCRAAGDRARVLYASHTAAEHYTRALEASARLGAAPDPTLLLSRAQTFDAIGDFSAAHADYEAALSAAEIAQDSSIALSSLLQLGLLWSGRDYDRALGWLLRAVDLARTMDDPAALAHALNRIGNWRANHEDIEDALRCHDEALVLFEQLGHQRGIAQTLDLIAMARNLNGDLLRAQDVARRAADLFAALDDRQGLAGVLILTRLPAAVFELTTLVGNSSIPEAISTVERALAITREIGWRSGEAFMLTIQGECWASAGDFRRALAVLNESIAIAEEIDHRQWLVQARWVLGEAYEAMFALERAREELAQALKLAWDTHSRLWIGASAAALASTLTGWERQTPPARSSWGRGRSMHQYGRWASGCSGRHGPTSPLPEINRMRRLGSFIGSTRRRSISRPRGMSPGWQS